MGQHLLYATLSNRSLYKNGILTYSTKSSVTLLFLSGTHSIPKNETLRIFNFSRVVISPLKQELKMLIECQLEANFVFENISNLVLSSLHFTFCSLQYMITSKLSSSVNITRCTFERSRKHAIIINSLSKLDVVVSNCGFLSNIGALRAENKDDNFAVHYKVTDTLFQGNTNYSLGGALYFDDSRLHVTKSQFINNTAAGGGAIYAQGSHLVIYNTIFRENSIHGSSYNSLGSAINLFSSPSAEIENCSFINNSAKSKTNNIGGGGTLAIYATPVVVINSHFRYNSANYGGGIYCFGYGSITLSGGESILNSANYLGGFARIKSCVLSVAEYTPHYIGSNKAYYGGAICASKSHINIRHNTTLFNNTARSCGGALYLIQSIILIPHSISLKFDQNKANDKGGAIFVVDNSCELVINRSQCFLQDYAAQKYLIFFANNSAPLGSIVYGGLLDRCLSSYKGGLGIDHIKYISKYEPTPMDITSDPIRVCLCTKSLELNCKVRSITRYKMRGQIIHLYGAVVDQDNNPNTSYIRASYKELAAELDKGEERKKTANKCMKLSYHIFASNTSESAALLLQPEGYCERSNFSSVTVYINLMPCRRGFEVRGDRCGCDKRLQTGHFNVTQCYINSDSIQKKGSLWLRYDEMYLTVQADCPLDYCQDLSNTISLAFPDKQCANNRSGVLCGTCRDNYSIALGSSKCLQCTSSFSLIWLIPVFVVAGIVLYIFLRVLNVNISHGTLNGLVLYANIVSTTRLTSLHDCSIHPILSVFIAWLNLDLGVETCFYPGMDTYQKTWLQFAFPLYIWLLVGAIILVSHYSPTAMKVFGRNNIAVLATLFLLSYTKILNTIITAFSFTEIFQGSANDTSDQLVPYKVWTSDGSVEYLKGKHVPLFAIALLFLVF